MLALPAFNNETRLTQMADEPDLVPVLPESVERQIEPPEIVEGGAFTAQSRRFNLRKEFMFCCLILRRHS